MGLDCCCCPQALPGSTCGPLSRTFIVDGTTTAPLADQVGSVCLPFAKIGQAMTAIAALPAGQAALALVGPGVYVEQVVWPNRSQVALAGAGIGKTEIVAPALASSALRFAPPLGAGGTIHRLDVRDVTLRCDTGQWCAELEGLDTFPETVLSDGAYFLRVEARPAGLAPRAAVNATAVGGVYAIDCSWASSTALGGTGDAVTNIFNVTTFFATRSRLGNLRTEYDDGSPAPASGRSVYQIDDSTQIETQWRMVGHPICVAQPGSLVRGAPAALAVDATGLTNGAIAGHTPIILLLGGVGNPVVPTTGDVSIILPKQAPLPSVVSLQGGTFLRKVTVAVGAGVTRIIVPGWEATFLGTAPGDITAGALVDLDLRMAKFEQFAIAVAASGRIDRSMAWIPAPVVIPVLPATAPVAIIPPYPAYVGAAYSVVSNQVGVPVPGPAISGQAPGTFSVASSAPGGAANFTLLRV